MAPLKVVIVGAVIGGLAAAIGLARNGHQVTVYERLSSTTEIGYAFRITAHSDRCLRYLRIDTIAGRAVAANSTRTFNAQGEVVLTFKENSGVEKGARGTSVFAFRPQLHQQLMQVALDSGVKVNSGSIVRPYLLNSKKYFPKPSTGQSAILVYPVDYDRQSNITCTYPSSLSDRQTSEGNSATAVAYNQNIPFEQFLSIYRDFDPIARRLFSIADPEGFRVWQLKDMDDHPNWSLNHTTLLGDACHPVLPFGFSGASMAIEDGVTLSTLLLPEIGVSEIPARLNLYQEIRRPRVLRVREASRDIAEGLGNQKFVDDYMSFLSPYDAVEYVKQILSGHLKTASGSKTPEA